METNKLHIGDNLEILRNLPDASIDLIYIDPPYNVGYNLEGRHGSTGIGFSDAWGGRVLPEEDKQYLGEMKSFFEFASSVYDEGTINYLIFMYLRLRELKRVLKETGNIFVQCDEKAGNLLQCQLDFLFGKKQFKNIIVWQRSAKLPENVRHKWGNANDVIFFYANGEESTFHTQRYPYNPRQAMKFCNTHKDGRKYYEYFTKGYKKNEPAKLHRSYMRDGLIMSNMWIQDETSYSAATGTGQFTGYATQKPLGLLRRIIRATSNPGDIVLDAFAGSGTTMVAAKELNRRYIGIEMNEPAREIIESRLEKVTPLFIQPSLLHDDSQPIPARSTAV